MHAFAYADFVEDSGPAARARDGKALDVAIDHLKRAEEKGTESLEAVEALYFTMRLWSAFLDDLGRSENGLEKELRAALISVGIGMLREVERVRTGESRNFKHLIEVCSIVREGLR